MIKAKATFLEAMLSFSQLAKCVPPVRGGKSPAPSTIHRWAFRGIQTVDGRRVRLRCQRIGGTWMSDENALAEFLAELNFIPGAVPAMRTPAEASAASRRAAAELDAVGFGV